MGIPQVPEEIRRAPLVALRAVFAGIGRILVTAVGDEADQTDVAGPPAEAAGGAGLEQRKLAARRAAEQQAAARRATEQQAAARREPAARREAATRREPGARREPAARARPAARSRRPRDTPALPLANYDSLSLASIRARLRGLDVSQLRVLLDYEAVNAERPEVIGMFERRIEKLESGG